MPTEGQASGLADWLNQGASAISEGADREPAANAGTSPSQSTKDNAGNDKSDDKSDDNKIGNEEKDEGWQQLSSSNLSAYKYKKEGRDLGIIFHGGRLYTYHAVPEDVAKALGHAGSPGSYFHHHIKKKFAFTKGGRAT
jgi:hypothetical protein